MTYNFAGGVTTTTVNGVTILGIDHQHHQLHGSLAGDGRQSFDHHELQFISWA